MWSPAYRDHVGTVVAVAFRPEQLVVAPSGAIPAIVERRLPIPSGGVRCTVAGASMMATAEHPAPGLIGAVVATVAIFSALAAWNEFLLALLGSDRHIDLKAAKLGNRGAPADKYPYDIARLKSVTRRAAEMADWSRAKSLPKGRGMGIACCRSFLGYTGHVVEVQVDRRVRPEVAVAVGADVVIVPEFRMLRLPIELLMTSTGSSQW